MDAPAAVSGATSWPALTAWGAGLIQIALGAGATMEAQGGAVLFSAGIASIGLGAAGFAWGGTALARGRLVVPRAGVVGVLLGMAAMAVALTADPARFSVMAVAAASALLVATGIGCARASRRVREAATDASGRLRLTGLLVSAAVVAAVVTPALAATEASQLRDENRPVVLNHSH